MTQPPIVILAARRTPLGAFQGALASVSAPALAAHATRAALTDARCEPEEVSEVILGCVLSAGLGQAPARQAALSAGLPATVGCTTVNKVCGSGMQAVMLACDMLHAGSARIVLAGGMESMSNAPYLLPKARAGYRLGHHQVLDHLFQDGLQNPYDGQLMGYFADVTAQTYGFGREAQDAFAVQSVRRALAAIDSAFHAEITPVTVETRQGDRTVATDEEPGRCDIDRIATMRPAFSRQGTVTAASSSSIADGAAALALATATEAERLEVTPLARIVASSRFAHAPEWFTTAPVTAIRRLLATVGWRADEVDLYEINEAFAVVTLFAIRELGLDPEKVNINGGACALGHPLGATGARILVTLVHALRARGLRRGIACLCIGGGEATAIAVEVI